jgi:hypothetical protein
VFGPLGPQESRVVRERQLAAIPAGRDLECKTLGSWKTGWTHECHASLTTRLQTGGDATEQWAWAVVMRPIRNAS